MKRDIFTLQLDLGQELVIDNFAGGGGTSTGLEAAFGRPVDIAINHDPEALAMHAMNHPHTKHLCESVWDVDPIKVTNNQPVGLVWLSPDCKHFSKAKGGKPVEKKIRGLAWVTMRWALHNPRVIMLENVEEFRTWGPLIVDEHGNARPDPDHKGQTFEAFVAALSTGIPADHPSLPEIIEALGDEFPVDRLIAGLGYKVEYRELRASDHATPTIRKRFFLVARRDGLPILWPAATHGAPTSVGVLAGKLLPHRTAAECIDWSIPCPSIFERKKPLADATLRRIAKGIMRYVVDAANPFIVGQGGPVYGGKPVSVHQPMGTIPTESHRAVVVPSLVPVAHQPTKAALVTAFLNEHANASNQRVMPADEPLRTICAQVKGGHFSMVSAALVGVGGRAGDSRPRGVDEPTATVTSKYDTAVATAFLAKNYTGVVGSDLANPIGTITSQDHHSLVTSNLIKLRGTSNAAATDEPLGTISAQGQHHAEVRAFLLSYYGSETDSDSTSNPLRTITSRERFGLVTIQGQDYEIVDIGLRMLAPPELYRAQGFPLDYIIHEIPDPKLLFVDGQQTTEWPLTLPRIPLTKSAQVRMCGNSVCPPLSEALIRANFMHEREMAMVAA
jgi:DNA (cytosine-5)-methyltransferase 1